MPMDITLAIRSARKMENDRNFLFVALFLVSLPLLFRVDSVYASNVAKLTSQLPYASIHIGVILDLNSPMGAMADICLAKARSDFYTEHSEYKTRLFLHTKSAEEEVDMTFAGDVHVFLLLSHSCYIITNS